ncbi:AAA+ superfamily predicted ATPase [Duganella sp. SG902]|uniref:ATP-binding protein n=1 Tax=Duganella sp. SG902 TaxID=2587016 RepID=UPI00159D3053|nr:ATP-binding protein [Duganella sp. SG902]NVM78414.1 AAA+ superfamily predicted ATPase [Duganella sp. SG902]
MVSADDANAAVLAGELAWLEAVIAQRFHARNSTPAADAGLPPAPPALDGAGGAYARTVRALGLDASARLLLALMLAPHLAPEILDPFWLQNQVTGRRFSEFGGETGQSHIGFLPTVETALFLLAGADLPLRLRARCLFRPQHPLCAAGVMTLDQRHAEEPLGAAAIRLSREYLEILLTGSDAVLPSSGEFPAERIDTPLEWDDLVIDDATRAQIHMISDWLRHADTLMHDWDLRRRLKPGYRCLFYGTPGTGKTLTASLLGKQHQMPVYRVDLSRVVSKWIGETEKNLAALFDRAQRQNWILFFDEAEALFGRRTEAQSSNDRSANQQIAYLLQRLEDFPGMVILATNQRGHMDDAFARRFQSTILFPLPDVGARLALWEKLFRTGRIALAPQLDFAPLAEQYALAGGAILNVLRYACLRAVTRTPQQVQLADIMAGIKQELQKDGHYLQR